MRDKEITRSQIAASCMSMISVRDGQFPLALLESHLHFLNDCLGPCILAVTWHAAFDALPGQMFCENGNDVPPVLNQSAL